MAMHVREETRTVDGLRFHVRRAGEGPLILFLHGWPQTSYAWRRVLPVLARDHTVVAPDLRGYGASSRPRGGYDKRTMSADMSGLMHELGYTQAVVVGHDRGARVAHRWGLERPHEISRLMLLSVVPTLEMWRHMDARVGAAYWHWLFHLVPDLPEFLTEGKGGEYVRFMLAAGAFRREAFTEADLRHYAEAYAQPGALRASFDDYRAARHEDLEADEADAAAGRRLTMPVHVAWGAEGLVGSLPVLDLWRDYATRLEGAQIASCGHFPAEEQPDVLVARIRAFLDAEKTVEEN
ncbi:Pimeloyl-ACP methyl ester carboxylesterase [Saccharopolyspora shandongensis]|uniref:Pimeloyl-ACP methyl ester carboxylesterase n=2 Tax=Pseudonocardiaceae TaxID=2070 RepID=A0A1H3SWJ7_9PSEU|nr:Pimeloyl-ACP methyl ester carboxylesterase [Saccharopolyspora shandongensis]